MLRDYLRNKLTTAIKEKDEIKKNLLRLVMGDVNLLDARSGSIEGTADDKRILNVIRKLIESNKQTIDLLKNSEDIRSKQLLIENEYLNQLLPKSLSEDEVLNILQEVSSAIKDAKIEGMAIGIAHKYIKSKDLNNISNEIVTLAVKRLRN